MVVAVFSWWMMTQNREKAVTRGTYAARLGDDHIIFPNTSALTYYYDLKPDTLWEDSREWLGYRPVYTINHDGLNERFEYAYDKPDRRFRILTIGDSTTFGLLVNTKENYAELLEDLLNTQTCEDVDGFEVINLGVPGYDIAFTVERFKQKGIKYHPDLVIWFVNFHNYSLSRNRIIAREQELLQKMSAQKREKVEREGTLHTVSEQATAESSKRNIIREVEKEQRSAMSELLTLYTGPVIFVELSQDVNSGLTQVLEKYVTSRPNTWMDLGLPDLPAVGGLLDDQHPSVLGHKMIAAEIFAYLYGNGLYPCHKP